MSFTSQINQHQISGSWCSSSWLNIAITRQKWVNLSTSFIHCTSFNMSMSPSTLDCIFHPIAHPPIHVCRPKPFVLPLPSMWCSPVENRDSDSINKYVWFRSFTNLKCTSVTNTPHNTHIQSTKVFSTLYLLLCSASNKDFYTEWISFKLFMEFNSRSAYTPSFYHTNTFHINRKYLLELEIFAPTTIRLVI